MAIQNIQNGEQGSVVRGKLNTLIGNDNIFQSRFGAITSVTGTITISSTDAQLPTAKAVESRIDEKLAALEADTGSNDVLSVNGQSGSVVLSTTDVPESGDNLYISVNERAKLSGIEDGAEVNTVVPNDLPTNLSELTNDSGFITGYTVTAEDVQLHQGTLSIDASQVSNLPSGSTTSAVESVNGQSGSVVLNSDDIAEGTTNKYLSTAQESKLASIESGAEVNVNPDWNSVSGDNQILNKPSIPQTVSDLTNDAGFITDYTVTQSDVTNHQGAITITEAQISDLGNYLEVIPASYIEDLDNISRLTNDSGYITGYTVTEQDVTQHTGSITITESQITDLGNYLTTLPVTVIEDNDNISRLTNDSGFITSVTQADVTQYESFLTIDASQVTNLPSGSSGGAVDSVNGQSGSVVLDADDLNEGATNLFLSSAERTKLSGIATGAEVNVKADWNAVSGDAQILNKPTIVSSSTDLLDSAQLIRTNDNISSLTNDSGFITGYTVTQLDVTQHQAAITITESQISDLGNYLTSVSYLNLTGAPSDVISAGSNLSWDGNTLNVAATTVPVDSVNTQTGAVVLDTDDIAEGVTNKYMSGDTYDQSTAMGTVVHGATAATARPTGYNVVTWIGSVEPTNATNDDIWFDTTA